MRKPFSRRRRRMPWFFTASIPRGLITATASSSFKRLVSSLVTRSLTSLLMIVPHRLWDSSLALADRQLNRRRHRGLDHDLLEVRALARGGLHLADLVD